MRGVIISIINNKGGCGKTTTAINLAHALSREGQRVLLVDLDSQCNATDIVAGKTKIDKTTADLINPKNGIDIELCIYQDNQRGIDFIPSSSTLAAVEPEMIKIGPSSLNVLSERLRIYAKDHYDFVLIDNPPNLGNFVLASLMASDFALVPHEAGSRYSLEGLMKALNFIEDIGKFANPNLLFLRLLITKVDKRMSVCRNMIDFARRRFSQDKIFSTVIPISTEFQKAEMAGDTIFERRGGWAGSKAYRVLAEEIMTILNREKPISANSGA